MTHLLLKQAMRGSALVAVGLGVLLSAGGAKAEGPAAKPAATLPQSKINAALLRSAVFANPGASATLPVGPGIRSEPTDVAVTSVQHRFAGARRSGLVGAAGFLCGLKPGDDNGGAVAAYGYDPNGRFLGAKLSLAF